MLTVCEEFLHQAIHSIFRSVNRTILVIRLINQKALRVYLLLDRKLTNCVWNSNSGTLLVKTSDTFDYMLLAHVLWSRK